MRARIVVTGGETTLTFFEQLRVVDALVYPVPDTSADTHRRTFKNIPVFAEITHTITHGVVIFAHEERLSSGVRALFIRRSFDEIYIRIHLAVDVSKTCGVTSGIGGSFVVDGTCIERTSRVVSSDKVVACTALITQRPEDNTGVVAVAQHHALSAVQHHRLPACASRDDLGVVTAISSMVVPVFVAFDVGFVHDVKAIIVEHGIHLGLTRIVGGADGVHIGLLHEEDVAKHGGYVHGAALFGVSVLGVNALEEDTLTIDAN